MIASDWNYAQLCSVCILPCTTHWAPSSNPPAAGGPPLYSVREEKKNISERKIEGDNGADDD